MGECSERFCPSEEVRGLIGKPKVKCLSIRQPWAWLVANGWKNIENRTWRTNYRGRLLIHAAGGMTRGEWHACLLFVCGFAPGLVAQIPTPENLPRGGIVGEAVLLDCVQEHGSDWFCGPWGWVLADARPLPFRLCRGRLGLFRDPGVMKGGWEC